MMSKRIFFMFFALIWDRLVQAQNVYIPDSSFKAALVSNSSINTNGDGEIQVTEAQVFSGIIDVSS